MNKADLYKISDPHREQYRRRLRVNGLDPDREFLRYLPKDADVKKESRRKHKKC